MKAISYKNFCTLFLNFFYLPFYRGIITLDQASSLTTTLFEQAKTTLKPKAQQVFEDRRRQLKVIVDTTIQELQTLTIRFVFHTKCKLLFHACLKIQCINTIWVLTAILSKKWTLFTMYLQCTCRVQCSLAKAAVELDALPEKLNPVIRPLMDCIKKEQNKEIQVCIYLGVLNLSVTY